MQYGLFFETHAWVASASLGFARVAPVFFILPFLNSSVLSGIARVSVSLLVAIGIWPHEPDVLSPFQTFPYLTLIAREVGVGVLLGCLLSWPFWVFHALGSIIDNQRGATLSSSIDPATGVDTSEMANFLSMFAAVIYLQGGGLMVMLDVFRQSYQLCDPMNACMPSLPPLLGFINQITGKALLLASPIIITLLLSEVILGLLSRFAPQMNAFAISLTVKSGIALFIMLLYFSPVLPDHVLRLSFSSSALDSWLQEKGH